MSAIGVIAMVSPLLPASLLIVSLRAKRALDVLAPLQFVALVCGAVLAIGLAHAQGANVAALTVLLAFAGLLTAVLRKDSIARRAAYSFDWEKFERDLHFYSIIADLW